jgi:ATP-dependent exoDNAse (exonuclease V) beta subunit
MASAIGSLRHKGDTDVIVLGDQVGYSVKIDSYQTITNDIYQNIKRAEARDRRDEEARILYVAMTRAKRRFIYFDDRKASGSLAEPKNWQILLRGEADI